jgi:hypothetical protein
MGLKADLDMPVKRKIPIFARNRSLVAHLEWAILAHIVVGMTLQNYANNLLSQPSAYWPVKENKAEMPVLLWAKF